MDGGFQALDGMKTRKYGSGGGGTDLQSDVPSTCYCMEASRTNSYSGSGVTWSNNIAAPADGSAQTDFDVYRGDGATSSTYPAFNGTAGTPGAYFSNDGGDYFLSKQVTNVSPGFLRKMQRTDDTVGFWMAFAFRAATAMAFRNFQNVNSNAQYGVSLLGTSTILQFNRNRNSTPQSTSLLTGAGTFNNGTDYLVIVSMDAARNNFRVWKNTRTAVNVSNSGIWTAVTTDASNRFAYGTNYPTINAFDSSGQRYYGSAGGNAYIDNTAAGKIFDYFNASTGITFA